MKKIEIVDSQELEAGWETLWRVIGYEREEGDFKKNACKYLAMLTERVNELIEAQNGQQK